MSVEALSAFIAEYIAGRRQTKLEAFDKATAKRSEDSATLAAERAAELAPPPQPALAAEPEAPEVANPVMRR